MGLAFLRVLQAVVLPGIIPEIAVGVATFFLSRELSVRPIAHRVVKRDYRPGRTMMMGGSSVRLMFVCPERKPIIAPSCPKASPMALSRIARRIYKLLIVMALNPCICCDPALTAASFLRRARPVPGAA